jgi:hypothetical protein
VLTAVHMVGRQRRAAHRTLIISIHR